MFKLKLPKGMNDFFHYLSDSKLWNQKKPNKQKTKLWNQNCSHCNALSFLTREREGSSWV